MELLSMSTLGERIKNLRGAYTQKWLAEQLDIPSTTLSNYENNKSELNFATIQALKTIFKFNTDWLLFGVGAMNDDEASASTSSSTLDQHIRELEMRIVELEKRAAELEKENAMLKQIADARAESLRDKEENLKTHKLMLRQAQNALAVLEKEGVIVSKDVSIYFAKR